jgi:fumarate reductase flavoprotein subunit
MTLPLRPDFHTDLVVIGAGGAGLSAAAAALQSGVRDVLILDKAPAPGGNTIQSAGMFAVDSPAQKRKGIEVSARIVFQEKMAYAGWRVDPRLVRECIHRSGETIGWLEGKGMRFDNVIEFLREGRAPKVFHSFSLGPAGFIGKKIVDTLVEECAGKGARILCETAATSLVRAGGGEVSGVRVRAGDTEATILTRAAVLATGGFGGSRSLLEKYFPGHGDVFTKGDGHMTGDGLLMAEAAGAATDDNLVLLVTGPHHYPWSHVLTLLVRRPELLLVNRLGERYSDETIFLDYHTEAGNALSRQPGMICYGLLDSSLKQRIVESGEIVSGMEREAGGAGAWLREIDRELEAAVAGGTVKKAGSWEELAAHIGAEPAVMVETVERYNTYCDRGCDEEFCKEATFLVPLRTPPYYAVLGRQGFDTTLGGISVNHRMEVADRQGGSIPGLYAAGDCATGWEHDDYNLRHPGSAMTFALCAGLIAGEQAAAYIRRVAAGGPSDH